LPGDGGIRTRRVAILVAAGAETRSIEALQKALLGAGAVPQLVGPRLGTFEGTRSRLEATASMENSPAVLFDALALPDGQAAVDTLMEIGNTMEFVKDQYRHCKTILAFGASQALLSKAGISATLPNGEADPGLFVGGADLIASFIEAMGRHRHSARDLDPPLI
jgi:catalase